MPWLACGRRAPPIGGQGEAMRLRELEGTTKQGCVRPKDGPKIQIECAAFEKRSPVE